MDLGSGKTGHQVKIGVSGAGDTGSAGSSPRKLNLESGHHRKVATGILLIIDFKVIMKDILF